MAEISGQRLSFEPSAGFFCYWSGIRDSCGLLIKVAAKCFQGAVSMEIAEAVAVLEGIHLALSSDFSPIVVATDALSVVHLCNAFSVSRCEVANVVVDVQLLLSQNSLFSIVFSPRNSNIAAHDVARWALSAGFAGTEANTRLVLVSAFGSNISINFASK
ncbi:hypothetical protein ACOSP7_015661 [Xanthoceras sorbifolium]